MPWKIKFPWELWSLFGKGRRFRSQVNSLLSCGPDTTMKFLKYCNSSVQYTHKLAEVVVPVAGASGDCRQLDHHRLSPEWVRTGELTTFEPCETGGPYQNRSLLHHSSHDMSACWVSVMDSSRWTLPIPYIALRRREWAHLPPRNGLRVQQLGQNHSPVGSKLPGHSRCPSRMHKLFPMFHCRSSPPFQNMSRSHQQDGGPCPLVKEKHQVTLEWK